MIAHPMPLPPLNIIAIPPCWHDVEFDDETTIDGRTFDVKVLYADDGERFELWAVDGWGDPVFQVTNRAENAQGLFERAQREYEIQREAEEREEDEAALEAYNDRKWTNAAGK